MNIPESFKEELGKDPRLLGIVNSIITKFESIINESRYTFFEEYTNHGISHLETVLSTAEWIMGDSIKELNSNDISVLILSVFLHDLGMHISYDGLMSLIYYDLKDNKIDYFKENNWNKEWEVFFQEAKKWNEKKLKSIFGTVISIKEPPKNEQEANGYDKKLFGEFLRRNHHRLAHEISIFGFPGYDSKMLSFSDDLDKQLKDLSGLVARSHGIDIRNTFEYLKKGYVKGWRTPYSVKVIYLMIVLQLADYLHITPDRASKIILQQRRLASPYSKLEWDLHNSVEFISRDDDDPETLYVQSKPGSSLIYLKLINLLRGMQNELDSSWAILGEVYGRFPDLNNLGVSIRRIQSNIDNIEWLYENVDYIPRSIHFDADSELLKLLVAPLYGDNPSYGIRELLQNAIDSCSEKEYLLKEKYGEEGCVYREYFPQVEICFESADTDKLYLVIKDNGVGMNENILVNYFFKAGASFRKSSMWLNEFTDENGKSKIQRSGRFGIGVLAAFLLGNEILVTTKNINNDYGFKFKADIDSEQIEVKRVNSEEGTVIKILLNHAVYDKLKMQAKGKGYGREVPCWNKWYQSDKPKLSINYPTDWYVNNDKTNELIDNNKIINWVEVQHSNFNQIVYHYNSSRENLYGDYWEKRKLGELFCNGIVIPKGYGIGNYNYPKFKLLPTISVVDYDSNLPLALNRNGLSEPLPFENELLVEICRDIVAKLFMLPNFKEELKNDSEILPIFNHPALKNIDEYDSSTHIWGDGEILLFRNGYTLPHSYCLDKLKVTLLTKVWRKSDKVINFNEFINENNISVSYSNLNSFNILRNRIYDTKIEMDNIFDVNNKRIFLPTEKYLYAFSDKVKRLRREFKEKVKIESENEFWTIITDGMMKKTEIDINLLDQSAEDIALIIEYEISAKTEKSYKDDYVDIMSDILREYLGDDVLIPYDFDERKRKFPLVFEKLRRYMEFLYENNRDDD